jgi:hypothetical protein
MYRKTAAAGCHSNKLICVLTPTLCTAGISGRDASGSFDDDDSVDSSSEQAEVARDAAVAERRNSALLHPPDEHGISVPGMVLHHVTGHEIAYLAESAEGESSGVSGSVGAPGSADSGSSSSAGFSQVNLSTPSIADQETFHKVSDAPLIVVYIINSTNSSYSTVDCNGQ